jgi:photosynthetic reaction center cytochrome c subunit
MLSHRATPPARLRGDMKPYLSAVWSLVLGIAIAPSAAAQQPGSAGATRPNLKVLQALPESQLFPLMNLVADSLGVRCDYCHVQATPDFSKTPSNVGGWIFDRDDKPQKRTALEMMRMIVDLNAGRFRGQMQVTCYTCHRGSTRPSRLPPLAGSTRTPAATPLPPADRVWTDYVNAVGRSDASPRTAMVFRGWDDRSEGRYGKFEVTVTSDRYRATVSTAQGTTSQGVDAEGAWVTANDRVLRLSAAADLARIRRIVMRYRPVKERPSDLRVVGIDRVGGRDAYVATGRIDAVTTQTMYFDIVSGLLRRDLITIETLLLPLEEQTDYDDYRDVNGVKMPFHIHTSEGAPYGDVTRTMIEIRRDVAVEDALFRP